MKDSIPFKVGILCEQSNSAKRLAEQIGIKVAEHKDLTTQELRELLEQISRMDSVISSISVYFLTEKNNEVVSSCR